MTEHCYAECRDARILTEEEEKDKWLISKYFLVKIYSLFL